MIGAIAGDIIGSIYEWHNIKTKSFPLFQPESRFTDDSVLTCAVARAIMNGGIHEDYLTSIRTIGRPSRRRASSPAQGMPRAK